LQSALDSVYLLLYFVTILRQLNDDDGGGGGAAKACLLMPCDMQWFRRIRCYKWKMALNVAMSTTTIPHSEVGLNESRDVDPHASETPQAG